jgi:hypothetical protein
LDFEVVVEDVVDIVDLAADAPPKQEEAPPASKPERFYYVNPYSSDATAPVFIAKNELQNAITRYMEKTLDYRGDSEKDLLPLGGLMAEALNLMALLKPKKADTPDPQTGKDRYYLDTDAFNDGIEEFLMKLNKNHRNLAIKNGHRFYPIERRDAGLSSAKERLRSDQRAADFNKKISQLYPYVDGESQKLDSISDILFQLKNEKGIDKKDIPNGWTSHSRYTEYERLMQDADMKGNLGKAIAAHFATPTGDSSIDSDFIDLDTYSAPTANKEYLLDEFTGLSMQMFALKAVGALKGPSYERRFLSSANGDTIISVPIKPGLTEGGIPELTGLTPKNYLESVSKALDRSVKPDKSKYKRVINLMSAEDHPIPSLISSGEVAHYNSANMQVTVFVDRVVANVEKFNNTPAGPEKDALALEYADPRARESVDSLLRYTVAHELGHMMANHIWDHPELNAQHYNNQGQTSSAPLWRFRGGLTRMKEELKELQKADKVSTYGSSSTDEWFAEAYAKYIFSGEAHSEDFKKLLDDYGLVRGKAKKWLKDNTSTSPQARDSIDAQEQNTRNLTNIYTDVGKREALKDKLYDKALKEILGFGNMSIAEKTKIYNSFMQLLSGSSSVGVVPDGFFESQPERLPVEIMNRYTKIKDTWNGSSNAATPQKAMILIREIFSMDEGTVLPEVGRIDPSTQVGKERLAYLEANRQSIANNPEGAKLLRKLLMAEYEIAQEEFRANNVTEFVLYRGWPRAVKSKGTIKVKTRPISSFSSSPVTAKAFTGGDGEITVGVIPAEKIFSFHGLGFGVTGEQEYLVLGGEYDMLNVSTEELLGNSAFSDADQIKYIKSKVGQGIEVETDDD